MTTEFDSDPVLDRQQDEAIEWQLLLQAIRLKYGYDLQEYAQASLRRRIRHYMGRHGLATMAALQHQLIHLPECFGEFFHEITIHVSEFFRDPSFFMAWRQQVVPELRQREFLKIWHAGCAGGEEPYSVAILLREHFSRLLDFHP